MTRVTESKSLLTGETAYFIEEDRNTNVLIVNGRIGYFLDDEEFEEVNVNNAYDPDPLLPPQLNFSPKQIQNSSCTCGKATAPVQPAVLRQGVSGSTVNNAYDPDPLLPPKPDFSHRR